MKYIYNPVTGTLDDVETPNLGEKYFASAETDEIIKTIDDKFGPGTVFPASDAPTPPKTIERDMFDNAFRDNAANGGMMRQNYENGAEVMTLNPLFPTRDIDSDDFRPIDVGGAVIPPLTIGAGAKRLSDILFSKDEGNDKKEIEKLDDENNIIPPEFDPKDPKFVENIIEKALTSKEIRDTLKDLKKDFENKSWKDTVKITGSPAQGTRESIPQKTNIPFFEKLNTYSKQKHAGNLKSAIREVAGLPQMDKKTGDKKFESLYTSILNAANRSGFKFETTQNTLESKIELSKVPVNFVDFTNSLKDSPAIINNRLKELKVNKNKVYNRQELQDILGIDTNKKRSNTFFAEVLKDQGLTPIEMPGGKKGFRLNETISALKDYSKNKLKIYESRKYDSSIKKKSSENFKLRSKVDGTDFTLLNRQINKAMSKTLGKNELYFPDSVAQLGHNPVPIALTERISMLNDKKLSDKIFNIQNYTWQGKEINYEVLAKTSAKLETALKKLNRFYNKKITEKNIGTVEEAVDEVRNYYDSAIESASEVSKKLPFHKEVVGKLNISVPEIGDKLTADNFSVDMSNVDPRFIIGNVDLLNPNVTKYKNLSKEEKIQYGQSIIDQKIEQLKEFYGPNGADFPPEIIEDLIEQFEFGDASTLGAMERRGLGKAAGGVIPDQEIMNYANGGRINYENGSPNPQLEGNDFLNELEFKFNNIDSVTLDDTPITFDDSKSKIAQVADLTNPKNIPYYADMATRAGLRVAEFGARIIPATGNLISDLIQKPLFKIKSSYAREGDNEILDYGETPENNNVKFVGGPIFSNFLNNITPTSTEKLVGLDTIINEEKKKMIARGSSSLPVKVAETAALGAEIVAPIFPGLKLLNSYAKTKKLPVNDDTKQLLEQDIDSVLTASGTDRRQFLQVTGASATVVLAKMLGIGDEVAVATKTAEKATAQVAKGVPPYFFDLVEKIRKLGDDVTPKYSTQERQVVTKYKDFELTEDVATGEITIQRIKIDDANPQYYDETLAEDVYMNYKPGKGQVDETTPNVADEYTEDTSYIRTTGPQKGDILDTVEGVNIEEILKDFQ